MATKTKIVIREPAYVLKDLDKAAEIALFYGFQPVKTPKIEKSDVDQANSLVSRIEGLKNSFPRPEEKVSLLRTFNEWGLNSDQSPVMLHYKRPVSHLPFKKHADDRHYSLDIIGSLDSIAEAITIRAAVAILADHGHDKVMVDINSIGDKLSIAQFERELLNFTRKHAPNMPPEVKQQLKKDPFEVWRCDHESWLEVRDRAPQSLSYLSEQSGEHFGQVLEYLETLNIPYRINNNLIGHRHYCSHTIFEIKAQKETAPEISSEQAAADSATDKAIGTAETSGDTTTSPAAANNAAASEETFAIGTRHNYIARRLGFKRETPIVSVNLGFKKTTANPKLFFKNKPQPKFFFIQFGSIAKLKSLAVIEALRQARIPVHHQLTNDKFIGQLATAETLKTPYVIIMGQKEALENTVVVRHLPTRSQEIILLPELPNYLSKLHIAA